MAIEEAALLAALRGDRSVDDVCRAAGVTAAEFEAARAADLKRRLPPADARLRAAVRGPVEILRDGAGVPHVYAQTTGDLYFGLGFAMAQDRLWQIDRLRRRALGRQAEVLGPAYAASDLVHLTVGIDRIAAAEAERLDDATRSLVEAFVAGLNRQIEECGDALPIEFSLLDYAPRPFTAADVVAILRGMWWSLNGRLETLAVAEAARLLPSETLRAAYLTPEAPEERIVPAGTPYPPAGLPLDTLHDALDGRSSDPGDAADGRRTPVYGGTAVGRPPSAVAEGSGSNNWAVAGRRTASGHAILCSDPHQAFWLPSSWYEFAVHGPEDSAAGAGHPGVPGIWSGTNGDVAWGITNNAASTRDLYREQVHLEDPSRYRDGDAWRVFDERAVEIPVRGEAPRRFTVRSTVRGPIVNE